MICEQNTPACLDQRYPGDMTAPYAEMDTEDGIVTDCACYRGIGSQANAKFRQNGLVRAARFHSAITNIVMK